MAEQLKQTPEEIKHHCKNTEKNALLTVLKGCSQSKKVFLEKLKNNIPSLGCLVCFGVFCCWLAGFLVAVVWFGFCLGFFCVCYVLSFSLGKIKDLS